MYRSSQLWHLPRLVFKLELSSQAGGSLGARHYWIGEGVEVLVEAVKDLLDMVQVLLEVSLTDSELGLDGDNSLCGVGRVHVYYHVHVVEEPEEG